MKTFAVDPITGDLTGGTHSDGSALATRIRCALRLHTGEDRYDTARGFPWREVWGARLPEFALAAKIKGFLLTIPGVTSVDYCRVTYDRRNRRAAISFSCNGIAFTEEIGA